MLIDILCCLVTIAIAFIAGKLVSKLGLPAILGWLITGMAFGPHALGLFSNSILDSVWFDVVESLFECLVGLMIGSELLWHKMKKAGKQIIVTTATESVGTFLVVSLVFGVIFWLQDIPLYLALLFGGIALATAPAPSLSIVNQMKTSGPVTETLIPMAALDDLIGAIIFFIVVAGVSAHLSSGSIPIGLMLILVFLPVVIGAIMGFVAGKLARKVQSTRAAIAVMVVMMLISSGIVFEINRLLSSSVLNFMMLGMAFSTVFANMIPEERLRKIMDAMNPIIGFGFIIMILNLGAPLDYHLIFSAGLYTVIYIVFRAIGKYSGAYFGAAVTHAPDTVKKYLGFTLLPHSGVSLVFTGIAVSVLSVPAPECAAIIQGTIAAAAVINEIIAVFLAKKGFELAGELPEKSK